MLYKRFLAAALALCCLALTSCAGKAVPQRTLTSGEARLVTVASDPVSLDAPDRLADTYERVTDGGSVALYLDREACTIGVFDKRSGAFWRAAVDPAAVDTEKINRLWLNYMNSMLSIRATKADDEQAQVQRYDSADEDMTRSVQEEDGRLLFTVTFGRTGITAGMEVSLEDDQLCVRVPQDSIREEGEYRLVSLEVMPFFGAAGAMEDSYILIPDGCGALMHFLPGTQRVNAQTYYFPVYSSHDSSVDVHLNREVQAEPYLPLPVYGIKQQDSAVLGFITEGEADAELAVTPESTAVALNRAGFQFKYRYSYNLLTSNIGLADDNSMKSLSGSTTSALSVAFEEELRRQDRELRFAFLQGESANYSGMANVYRNYLAQAGLLNTAAARRPALSLEFFCGILEPNLFFDTFVPMTDFEQAAAMLEQLGGEGVSGIDVTLNGWAKNGYGVYPSKLSPDSRLGGKNALEALAGTVTGQQGRLFLQTEPMLYDTSGGGFISRGDVLTLKTGVPVADSAGTLQVFNLQVAAERMLAMRAQIAAFDGAGLRLTHTAMVFNDYNQKRPMTRGDQVSLWSETLATLNQSFDTVVDIGNLYTLAHAAGLADIPTASAGLAIEDEDVPFFQMVVSGYLPYTAEPGNYAYDVNRQMLKWAEYGYIPHFEITWEETQLLKKTAYNSLFTSHYAKWHDTLLDAAQRFAPLSHIAQQSIVSHRQLQENVYETRYADGTTVYVNYTAEKVQIGSTAVEAESFAVVKGGGEG